jgi:hypothetical protein
VQVGEKHLPLAHPVVFLGDRFFDLQYEVGIGPHVVSRRQNAGAGADEVSVWNRRADPGVVLDRYIVSLSHEFVHAGRCDGDPVLVVLDFTRYADLHDALPSASAAGGFVDARSVAQGSPVTA